jgi:BMFP domain-containing protein YqiC
MLDSEFIDQFFDGSELNEDQKGAFKVLDVRLTDFDHRSELDVYNSCMFFTRLLTKIQKMENRIQELEEQLESTSYNLGELEDRVEKKGVYMEDW